MRKINPHDFTVARRGTSREINRQIALNLIRAHQPISRADLARLMNVRRGVASLLVSELLSESLIFEGAVGEAVGRGRRPTFLYIDSRQRCVVGVDIRASRTYILVTDLMGKQLGVVSSFQTSKGIEVLTKELARRIKQVLADSSEVGACEGVGVVVPGMVDPALGRVLHAPTLGWRDVNLRDPLAAALGVSVHIENSGKACALAQLWATRSDVVASGDSVFVSVSDGDSLTVLDDKQRQHVIRLAEIDAPEKAQAFGNRSRQHLAAICFDKQATVTPAATDRYRRTVARVACGGIDASVEQLNAGMAWVFDRYVTDRRLYAVQEEARGAGRGLWAAQQPMPPWEWRADRRRP